MDNAALESRISTLEKLVESQKKQIQNINKVLLEAVRITTIVEKAARLLNVPAPLENKSAEVKAKEEAINLPEQLVTRPKIELPPIEWVTPHVPAKIEMPKPPEFKLTERVTAAAPEVKIEATAVLNTPKILEVTKPKPPEPIVTKVEDPHSKEKLFELLKSEAWPVAVDPSLICDTNSEQDKEDRAEGILDLIIDIHMENLKFLDFGCGEGHVVNKSRSQNTKLSIGYDIKPDAAWDKWQKGSNIAFTTDWELIKNSGPYNVILLYDVIDHMCCSKKELQKKLKELKSILAPHGKIYVRCHPWTSKHGSHLYRQINKAYIHMVLNTEEIKELGYIEEEVMKFKHPVVDYNNLWSAAGLKPVSGPHHLKEGVDAFFKNTEIVKDRIQDHYKDSIWEVFRSGSIFPSDMMESQFIDYVLS